MKEIIGCVQCQKCNKKRTLSVGLFAVLKQVMNASLTMCFLLGQTKQFLLRRNFSMAERMICIGVHFLFVNSLVLDSKTPINPKAVLQIGSLMSTESHEIHM